MTIENINKALGTNFSLVKRNGQINDGNVRIMKRLADITEAEIEEFKRTDAGWNMTPAEKHAKGYHALRALDKWYREHGHGDDGHGHGDGQGAKDGITDDAHGDGHGGQEDGGKDDTKDGGKDGGQDGGQDDGNGDGAEDGAEDGKEDGQGADGKDGNGAEDGNGDGKDDAKEETKEDGGKEDDAEKEEKKKEDKKEDKGLTDTERQVKAMIARPQADGRPNNVYLHGPAGTGKSYMVKRIAESMNAGYWETGIVSMKEELLGFTDAGGRYVEPECVKILKNGVDGKDVTIMLFDEFDGMPNAVTLTWNNIFASRRFSTPEGIFNVHPSIRFVATGNTTMDGADADYDRETVDKSVKTRWIFKAIDYDKNVEKKLADAETVAFLQGLRRAKDNCGLELLVTYREFTALSWARDIINDGLMTMTDALDSCVFKGIQADDKDTLRGDRMIQKLIDNGNAWAMAL